MRFAYPPRVIVTTTSSSGIRSSAVMSPSEATSRVRRSSPYFSTISASSSLTISRWRGSLARIASYSSIARIISS